STGTTAFSFSTYLELAWVRWFKDTWRRFLSLWPSYSLSRLSFDAAGRVATGSSCVRLAMGRCSVGLRGGERAPETVCGSGAQREHWYDAWPVRVHLTADPHRLSFHNQQRMAAALP